jgi:hypothetical protein
MHLTLEHIEKELIAAGDQVIPGRLADYRIYLAAISSLHSGEMQKILAVKSPTWNQIREHKNSDKAADREWQATSLGQRELWLKWELKRLSTLSAAISSKLHVANQEAQNKY